MLLYEIYFRRCRYKIKCERKICRFNFTFAHTYTLLTLRENSRYRQHFAFQTVSRTIEASVSRISRYTVIRTPYCTLRRQRERIREKKSRRRTGDTNNGPQRRCSKVSIVALSVAVVPIPANFANPLSLTLSRAR